MARKVRASILILLAVALAGPAASDMTAALAAGAGTAAAARRSLDAALWQLLVDPGSTLEDGVAPELTVDVEVHRRVLLAGTTAGYKSLEGSKPVCSPNCGNPGGPYSPNCEKKHYCRYDSPR